MATLQKGESLGYLILAFLVILAISSKAAAIENINVDAELTKRLEKKFTQIYSNTGGKGEVVGQLKGTVIKIKNPVIGTTKFDNYYPFDTPSIIGGGKVTNCGSQSQTRTMSVAKTKEANSAWNCSATLTGSVAVEAEGGVPLLGKGKVTSSVSLEVSGGYTEGQSQSITWSDSYNVAVPPYTITTTQFVITEEEKRNVPFNISFIVTGPVDIAFEPRTQPTVTFYEHIDFKGIKKDAKVGDVVNNIGNDWNDIISSVKVGTCAILNVYEHHNFGGKSRTFYAGDYSSVGNDWNDIITSYKLEQKHPDCYRTVTVNIEEYLSAEERTVTIKGIWTGKVISATGDWLTLEKSITQAECEALAAAKTQTTDKTFAAQALQTGGVEPLTANELSKPLSDAKVLKTGVKGTVR